MGNDGSVGKPLPVAGAGSCQPRGGSTPIDGRPCHLLRGRRRLAAVASPGRRIAPTALTARSRTRPTATWAMPTRGASRKPPTCRQAAPAVPDPATLNANGTTTPVSVPNVDKDSSVVVLGANGAHLNLQATVSCGTGQSLLDYDTETNTSTVLLGPPVNGGGVIARCRIRGASRRQALTGIAISLRRRNGRVHGGS